MRKSQVIVIVGHSATLAVRGNNGATATAFEAVSTAGPVIRPGRVRCGSPGWVVAVSRAARLTSYSVVMSRDARVLLGLLLFNAISALGGGIALMTEAIPLQASWYRHTGFAGPYFPGVVLLAIVGGSSLIAALAMMKRVPGWQLSSILAGVVMLVWITGEIASIRGFHFLQVIYFVTGVAVIWFTPREEPVPQ